MNTLLALLLSTAPLAVTPQHLWSQPEQIHHIQVTGGLPPIYWQTQSGDITPGEQPNSFIYQAPRRYMQDSIRFIDRSRQQIQITIDILRPLTITPSIRHLPLNGETRFRIQGGSGQWQIEPHQTLTITKQDDNITFNIKAGSTAGLHTIQIHDQITHEHIQAQIHIYAPLDVHQTGEF